MASIVFAPHRIAGEVPSGAIDGANVSYVTAMNFALGSEAVYVNGRRLEGGGCDYVATESGGPGTGYDTITLLMNPMKSGEAIRIDYTTG